MKTSSAYRDRIRLAPLSRSLRPAAWLALYGLILTGCLTGGDRESRGSVIENEVAGVIVGTDGGPSAGARVRIFPADSGSLSGSPVAREAITDADGRFRFGNLAPGAYTLLGRKDSLYAFRDSIVVAGTDVGENDSVSLPPDTLKATGAIAVQVVLKAGDDPATIRGEVLGTAFNARAQTDGDLSMPGMPAGRLRIRFTSTLPGYKPLLVAVDVAPGILTQAGVLVLPY